MAKQHSRNYRPSGSNSPSMPSAACAGWLLVLPDAADGLLGEAEQQALDLHLAGCSACATELAEAQRGLAWLDVLRDHAPEPPQDMLANILAQTTGCAETGVSLPELPPLLSVEDLPLTVPLPARPSLGVKWLSWLRGDPGTWSTLLQPRLAMTGAMAFFSICLTLNLLGISLTQKQADAFRRDQRTVASTGAALLRSLEGLRLAYRVSTRVSELGPQQQTFAPGSAAQ